MVYLILGIIVAIVGIALILSGGRGFSLSAMGGFWKTIGRGLAWFFSGITLGRIGGVAIIALLIVISISLYDGFQKRNEGVVEFKLYPMEWTPETFGWQKIEGISGGNVIKVRGSYQQYFYNLNYPYKEVNPEGIQGEGKGFENLLPVPTASLGAVVGKVVMANGEETSPFKIGRGMKLYIYPGQELWVSVNIPQNWAYKGSPAEVFKYNKGCLLVSAKPLINSY